MAVINQPIKPIVFSHLAVSKYLA